MGVEGRGGEGGGGKGREQERGGGEGIREVREQERVREVRGGEGWDSSRHTGGRGRCTG